MQMPFTSQDILFGLIAILLGVGIAFLIKRIPKFDPKIAEEKTSKLIEEKKTEAKEYLERIKKSLEEYKKTAEVQQNRLKNSIQNLEKIINLKSENVNKKEQRKNLVEEQYKELEKNINENKNQIDNLESDYIKKLIEYTELDREEAKNSIIQNEVKYIDDNKQNIITKYEEIIKEDVVKEAKNILHTAIYKCNTVTSVESKATIVKLRKEKIKDQLLENKAENLIYLEQLLGVDIIFDDVEESITIAGFDLIKRNIATVAIEKLLTEKAINKQKIDKKIEEAKKETEDIIIKEGQKACKLMNIQNAHPSFVKIVGRLKFRTSYGQNILLHSLEVAFLSAILASEIGADIQVAKIAGFLHDVGKAIDHEIEESHDKLTKEIMTKFKFPEPMIHAAWAHHEAIPLETIEAHIVKASDALSAERPGARQESLEKYLERIQQLEETASSFEGVKKSFAISAGREVRIIVEPEIINDAGVDELAINVADKIEKKMSFPGKIKVNVIRTTRSTEYAK